MATESSFLLLNQQVGWQAIDTDNVVLEERLRLQSLPGNSRPLADAEGSFGGFATPTALALDAAGNLYVLDPSRLLICRFDPCEQAFGTLPQVGGPGKGPRHFCRPRAIAISARNDLYVADSGHRRVQLFALKGLPLRAVWGPYRVTGSGEARRLEAVRPLPADPCAAEGDPFPAGTWQPWDVALHPDGRAFISDYANGLIHCFDAQGRWRGAFDGADETGRTLEHPTHLALDREGRIYVVEEGEGAIAVLSTAGTFLNRLEEPAALAGRFRPGPIAFDAAGRLLICDSAGGALYQVDPQAGLARCRAFTGQGCGLAVGAEGDYFLADGASGRVYLLSGDVNFASEGRFIAGPLDSRLYRCLWHSIRLEGAMAPGTAAIVESYTSDAPRTEGEILNLADERWQTRQQHAQVGEDDWDCLLLSPPGRYLWLRLTLAGDGRQTPVLERIRAYYPRNSSLQFLPAVYREDPGSAEFLDRFLSIFDRVWAHVDETIGQVARFFDPAATPAGTSGPGESDFLSWLASWIGLTLDQHWPEARRRRLLQEAHELYRLRGTAAGLRRHVALYTGVEPQILEHFQLRRWLYLNRARLGDHAVLWGDDVVDRLQLEEHSTLGAFHLVDTGDPPRDPFHTHAHRFTLYVPLRDADETQRQTLHRIVDMSRPAHAMADIQLVKPRMRVGHQSIVGVNTVIGKYPAGVTAGETHLGVGSVLGPSADEAIPPSLRIGKRSRIGSSTRLD